MKLIKQKIADYGNISSPETIWEKVIKKYGNLLQENIVLIGLNVNNQVRFIEEIFKGGMDSCVIDNRIIFKMLLLSDDCTAFAIVHNHPSGNLQASRSDIETSKKVKSAADIMGFRYLDFVIINNNQYNSFRDLGLIN